MRHTLLLIGFFNPVVSSGETLKIAAGGDYDIINIEKLEIECLNGMYVRWLNRQGGWNYWYFDMYNETNTTKEGFEINNDFNNLEDTTSKVLQYGKMQTTKRQVEARFNNENFKSLFTSLSVSPKIYMYKGDLGIACNIEDWVEISITPQSYLIKEFKDKGFAMNISFDLPETNTMLL